MSAPVTERPRGTVRSAPRAPRTAPAIPTQRRTSADAAAVRAYARRDERLRRLVGGVRAVRTGPARRAQFVLLVMLLLGTGLVLTLGLSTAAAADSYRLQAARTEAGALTEQVERLRREVAVMGSAPELARRAGEMGMVPVRDPARVVVAPDGSVTVVGEPEAARAPAPPVAPPVAPTAPAADAPPAEAPADGTPAAETPAEGTATDGTATGDGGAPADAAPADAAPADGAPVAETPAAN